MKKHWKPILLWTALIALYGYWHLIPEVSLVNGTGMPIKHVEIVIPDDDKVYRNIMPGEHKSFRYHPRSKAGEYNIRIIMADDSILKETAAIIKPWNLGHKVIFELLPDGSIRVDLSYSVYDGA